MNLKPSRNREHGFYYRSAETGTAVKAEVYYDKGGLNYFSGGHKPRGIFVSLNPVTLKDGFESFILGAGICACIEPLAKFNRAKFTAACDRIDAFIPAAAAEFTSATRREVITKLAQQYAGEL
jgi:hypothetical protein